MPPKRKKVKHIVNVSGQRQLLSCPPWDSVKCEPGDVVHVASCPGVDNMVDRSLATPAFMFVEFDGELREGQYLIYAGSKGLRGYQYRKGEIPDEFLPDCMQPKKVDDKKGKK